MKSITKESHTLGEALLRMRTRFLAAEDRGETVVKMSREDVLNLKDGAFRCDDYARMDNTHNQGWMDGVQSQRISGLESCAKWAAERGHDDFAEYLTELAASWKARKR